MIETILLVFLVSKVRGYKIKNILKSWTIYPILLLEIINLIGQVFIFFGDYTFVQSLGNFKIIYLISYLLIIFKYEIYYSGIIGSIFMFIGGILNDIAIRANHGFMPVYPSLSYLTGYVNEGSFKVLNDIHILGNDNVNLKFLTDFIDLGYSILSIGDLFIRGFVFIILYNAIKKSN